MAHPNLSPSFPTPPQHPLHALFSSSCNADNKTAPIRPVRQPPGRLASPATPAVYEHFSALRSTHDVQQGDMFCSVCNGADDCDYSTDGSFECRECARACKDASCSATCGVELTSQCTDQCVVVACNDSHHDEPPCEQFPSAEQCGKQCSGEFDCTVFDQFFQCCNDYHVEHGDYKAFVPTPGAADYSFLADPSLDPYLTNTQGQMQQARETLTFPPLDSASSTPQLVPSPAFEPSPSPFSHTQSANAVSSPSPSSLPPPSLQTMPSQPPSLVQCKWSGCFATFNSLSELVGHVNLQHLRIPAQPAAFNNGSSYLTPPSASGTQAFPPGSAAENSLACLWGDCQVYPSSQSMPGSSSGDSFNVVDLLTSHLLQDHLGLPVRSPTWQQDGMGAVPQNYLQSGSQFLSSAASDSADTSNGTTPDGSPPTPVPEHDCSSAASHVCGWVKCGQSFSSCDALTEHITSTHIGSGRAHYDCHWEGCTRNGDNGFASKQKISRHMQSHTGHRPFQCKVCAQFFSEAATLAQHMRRHTQEKPYVCDFPGCGKAFAIAGALTIHKRTHNGSKPFKCTYCDRAFAESSNLSKHLRTHTGARPYSCTEPACNKSFARPDQLARHMNIHKRKAAESAAAGAVELTAS